MKVVLIGDSIRMGYQPLVQKKCTGATVWGPSANCRHSLWALDHFQEWVVDQEPDLLHVNFGIHDAVLLPDVEHQILLSQYRLCLRRFVGKVRDFTKARMIWASTTPLYAPEPEKPMAEWSIQEEADIGAYNAVAHDIAKSEGLATNDLHGVILRSDFTRCLTEDGCHMTEYGNEVLSDAVVEAIEAAM